MNEYAIALQRGKITPTLTTKGGDVLQRDRHQRSGSDGECESYRKKREDVLQRAAVNTAPVSEVSPIVHDVLRSPGQALDAETRT